MHIIYTHTVRLHKVVKHEVFISYALVYPTSKSVCLSVFLYNPIEDQLILPFLLAPNTQELYAIIIQYLEVFRLSEDVISPSNAKYGSKGTLGITAEGEVNIHTWERIFMIFIKIKKHLILRSIFCVQSFFRTQAIIALLNILCNTIEPSCNQNIHIEVDSKWFYPSLKCLVFLWLHKQ